MRTSNSYGTPHYYANWTSFTHANGKAEQYSSITGVCRLCQETDVWDKTVMLAFGSLSRSVSSTMAGGSFWDGFCNGLICAGLNHAMHWVAAVGGGITAMLKDLDKFNMGKQGDQRIPMQLCKYYCLEAIGKYFGCTKTMGEYRTIGERMIGNDGNTTISEIAEKCGFDVEFNSDLIEGRITANLANGNPIMLTLDTDGDDFHAVVLTGYRETNSGAIEYHLSNPDFLDRSGWVNKNTLSIKGYYIFTNPDNLIR